MEVFGRNEIDFAKYIHVSSTNRGITRCPSKDLQSSVPSWDIYEPASPKSQNQCTKTSAEAFIIIEIVFRFAFCSHKETTSKREVAVNSVWSKL